jgi:hypothetical protein
MGLPQRLTFVTLGKYSVARLREFYRSWGWAEDDGETDYASFIAGSVRLALYPIDRLRDEAAPGADLPAEGSWGGYSGYVADPEGHRWLGVGMGTGHHARLSDA